MKPSHKKILTTFILLAASISPACQAGGITVNGTRFIFPTGATSIDARVSNTSAKDNYLIQSWVETATGQKSRDFVVTPPLYLSKPDSGNILRLIRTGGHFPTNRETLFYLMVKAIPSINQRRNTGQAMIHVSTVTQLKLFLRPPGLKPASGIAPSRLTFSRSGNQLVIHNPTPYYLTLAGITAGKKPLQDIMVSPLDSATLTLPAGNGSVITLHAINDYGGLSAPLTFNINS